MANQEQIPLQQEQPSVAAKQVNFILKDIILNTNNKVSLLYPEHNDQDCFKCVSDFISKCCIRKPFTRSPDMYKEYMLNFGARYLAHSSEYVAPPSIDIVRQWFPTIGYGEEVLAKGTLRKSLLSPRWRLLMAQIIQCLGGKTDGFDQIANKDAIILYSLANGINIDYANILEDIILKLKKKQRETVVPYTRFISLLIMHKMKEGYGDDEQEATKGGSSKAPTGSKTGHSKKRKESISAIDSNPSQPPVSTTVDLGMHKDDPQATGNPTSLGVTSEARVNPQLYSGMSAFNLNEPIYSTSFIIHSKSASGNDASAVSIGEVNLGNSAPSDFVPQQHAQFARQVKEEASRTIKLEDLAKLVSNVQPSFKNLDSPEDDPIIIIESDAKGDDRIHATKNVETEYTLHKLELEKNKAEAALLKAQPFFPNVEHLNELLEPKQPKGKPKKKDYKKVMLVIMDAVGFNQEDIDITLGHNFLKLKGATVTIRGGRKIDEEVYISNKHACDPMKGKYRRNSLSVWVEGCEAIPDQSNVWDDGLVDVNPFGKGNLGFHEDYYDNPLLKKETESEPIIWYIKDEEEKYLFVNKYISFQEEPIVLVEEESCPVYNTDNKEGKSLPVYDTDIEDILEEEKGFVGKEGFGREEDNIEDVVVVDNDFCSSMIQTILSVDFDYDINTKSNELMSFEKSIIIKVLLHIPQPTLKDSPFFTFPLKKDVKAVSFGKNTNNSPLASLAITFIGSQACHPFVYGVYRVVEATFPMFFKEKETKQPKGMPEKKDYKKVMLVIMYAVIPELVKGELLVFFPKDTVFTSFLSGKVKNGGSFSVGCGIEHRIRRFIRQGNEPDPRDVKIASLKQQI
nr:hypothetical protein [Tanacetum cinerariifolium]